MEESSKIEGRPIDLTTVPEFPPNWGKRAFEFDGQYKIFYYNTRTGESTFVKPELKLEDDTGRRYWKLTIDKKTRKEYYDDAEEVTLESLREAFGRLKDKGWQLNLDETGRRYLQNGHQPPEYLDNVHECNESRESEESQETRRECPQSFLDIFRFISSKLTGRMRKNNYHKKKSKRKISQNKKKGKQTRRKKGKQTRRKKGKQTRKKKGKQTRSDTKR